MNLRLLKFIVIFMGIIIVFGVLSLGVVIYYKFKNLTNNTNEKTLISDLGGGDTLAAVKKCKNKLFFSHLSTAGGAFLEYLEGKDLPGLSVLK